MMHSPSFGLARPSDRELGNVDVNMVAVWSRIDVYLSEGVL